MSKKKTTNDAPSSEAQASADSLPVTENSAKAKDASAPANEPKTAPKDSAQKKAEPEKQPKAKSQEDKATANKAAATNKDSDNDSHKPAGGAALATLALLVALGSAGFSGWQWFNSEARQQRKAPNTAAQELSAQLQPLQQQLAELQGLKTDSQRMEQLERELATLPRPDALEETRSALRKMQATQQAFTLRFESAFGNTRQDWRLAEAEHLLRMASLRLSALQDLNSARHLIEAADQILMEQDDPAACAARDALAKALADIRALPALDRAGLFMRLGAMQGQVAGLEQLLPAFQQDKDASEGSRIDWSNLLDKASSYVRIDLNSDEKIQPLLASQEVTHIRLALGLALEQAQWAALNGEQEVYQQAVQQGLALLEHYFAADHTAASALRSQLQELTDAKVSLQMPDINPALVALQAYIQERTLERRAPEVQP